MWRLPVDADYFDHIRSEIADIKNTGGRWGGAITAAMFLKEFVDDTPWIHLDIAGTAWLEENKAWMPKGPSGVAVRTLVDFARHFQASRPNRSPEVSIPNIAGAGIDSCTRDLSFLIYCALLCRFE